MSLRVYVLKKKREKIDFNKTKLSEIMEGHLQKSKSDQKYSVPVLCAKK